MTYNKGTLDAYRKIITKDLIARSGSFSNGLICSGIISGSEYQNVAVTAGVGNVSVSGSSLLTGSIYFTGSGDTYVYQNGQIVTFSGSAAETSVVRLGVSGSSSLTGTIYLTGSTPNIVASQSGQVIQLALADSITLGRVTGSTLISGASIQSPSATLSDIISTNITASKITGSSYVSGSILYGKDAYLTYVTSDRITGSTLVSGSLIQGKDAVITNLTAGYITGSISVSGSILYGKDAYITYLTADSITGSTIVSGSTVQGKEATFTNLTAGYITGSTISGSTYQGSLVTALASSGSAKLINDVYLTGSSLIYLTQDGQIITISGSAGVAGLSISGSASLINLVYLTGSGGVYATQSGQVITLSGSQNANLLEGYTVAQIQSHTPLAHAGSHLSGSGDEVTIYSTQISDLHSWPFNIPQIVVTGSTSSTINTISGSLVVTQSISGSTILASTITGSESVSGASVYGKTARFTTGLFTTLTGASIVSGSSIYGKDVFGTNVIGTYITGSTRISGSLIQATDIVSSTISGSTISGSTGIFDKIVATYITGSTVSGSTLWGKDLFVTNIVGTYITGSNISGSTFSGDVIRGVGKSGSNLRHGNYYFETGDGMTLTENAAGADYYLRFESSGGTGSGYTGSTTVEAETTYSIAPNAGAASTLSRGDHTHGTPGLYETAAADVGAAGVVGTNASGSHGDHVHRGVLNVAISGSTGLYGSIYVSGSGTLTASGSGQVIIFSGSTGPTFDSVNATNVTATNITGSSILSGATIYGKDVVVTNLTGVTITGSTSVSGSVVYGRDLIVTNVSANYITGSTILSGATIYSPTAILTNVTSTNITGSTVSGSTIYGSNAILTYVTSTSITGSTISGSTVYADSLTTTSFNPANINATNITGSGTVSGSTVRATTLVVAGNTTCLGNISGSSISGSIPVDARANTGTTFKRHRLNFVQGSNMSIVAADDAISDEIDVTFTANTGSGELPIGFVLWSSSATGNYYAQNGNTGVITTSGSLTGIIQYCFNTLSNSGSIYLKEIQLPASTVPSTMIVIEDYRGERHFTGSWFVGTGTITNLISTNITATNITGSTVSGSTYMGNVITSVSASGSTALIGNVYLTGSNLIVLTQSGQFITFSGSWTRGYTSVANGGTIAHGLGVVPRYVGLSASGSNPLQFSYVPDATNITVYHTAGGNVGVFWRAEV